MEERNPALPAIEIALLCVFLLHIYKTVTMFVGNQSARPVRYVQKKIRRQAEPQVARLVDDDRLGTLADRLPARAREGVPVQPNSAHGRRAAAISTSSKSRRFANPLMVGVLRPLDGRRRLAPLARHRRAASSRSASTIRRWTPRLLAAGKILAVLIAGGFIVIAVWVYLTQAGGCAYEARREDSGRPDRPRSGTGTSSR